MAWPPVCLLNKKPARSSAETKSFSLTTGSSSVTLQSRYFNVVKMLWERNSLFSGYSQPPFHSIFYHRRGFLEGRPVRYTPWQRRHTHGITSLRLSLEFKNHSPRITWNGLVVARPLSKVVISMVRLYAQSAGTFNAVFRCIKFLGFVTK